jgi:DNA adenine methylase
MEKHKVQPYKKSADYSKSPFRYPGGKFYALKHIIPFLDIIEHDEFREPFVGGGSVFFGKKKVKTNWINDIEPDIINVYEHLLCNEKFESFKDLFDNEIATKSRHKEIRETQFLTKLEIAFKTYYLNRTSYSGIINKPAWGYKEGKSSPPKNWKNFLINANKKLSEIRITNIDFEDVIKADSDASSVLMYLDPPYFLADQKRAYKKPFELSDHLRLMETLKITNHKFCLSYDDCQEVRDLYKWANIYEKSWIYNTANLNGKTRIKGNELIITNYEVIV